MTTTFPFLFKDRERKDKCCASVIDLRDFLVWEVALSASTMSPRCVRYLIVSVFVYAPEFGLSCQELVKSKYEQYANLDFEVTGH